MKLLSNQLLDRGYPREIIEKYINEVDYTKQQNLFHKTLSRLYKKVETKSFPWKIIPDTNQLTNIACLKSISMNQNKMRIYKVPMVMNYDPRYLRIIKKNRKLIEDILENRLNDIQKDRVNKCKVINAFKISKRLITALNTDQTKFHTFNIIA